MNGKTAKLLRQVERSHRIYGQDGQPYSVDTERAKRGRATLPHRLRGRQTTWLLRRAAGR